MVRRPAASCSSTRRRLRLLSLAALFCSLGSMWQSAAQADASMDDCLRKNFFWCSRAARCIDSRKRCNGVSWDCPYNEDETDCPRPTATSQRVQPTSGLLLSGGCYLCGGTATCIVSHMYCNGAVDCPGGDDEINCRTLDDNPPDRPRPDWVWPVMSTVAGLVGGALLCTATALLVQRCRRVRRQRRRRELQCGAAAEASSGNACATDDVAVVVDPPPYDDALGRPFAAHNTVYFSTADAPPKYFDIIPPTQPATAPTEADAVCVNPSPTPTGSTTPTEFTDSRTISAADASAPT